MVELLHVDLMRVLKDGEVARDLADISLHLILAVKCEVLDYFIGLEIKSELMRAFAVCSGLGVHVRV